MQEIYQILKEYYGYSAFRPNQEEIITSVIRGKDTLALLPTGGGKSICFQVPGLYFDGICIVISPLISLMEDQVRALKEKKIKAEFIHSGMTQLEIATILDKCEFGGIKFLYLSPERVNSKDFRSRSQQFKIDLIAIDESHCISQWGYDFRPSYLNIKEFLDLHPKSRKIAVTATAKPKIVEDIIDKLGFKDTQIFKSSFERKNLAYHTVKVQNKDGILLQSLKKYSGSTIVYCYTRKEVKRVCKFLQLNGYSADFYHGGLNTISRKQKQNAWIMDQTRIMVATNAFGMGIDKPDVRLVIHYDIPENIENYFQEAGRGGRDLEESLAVLLFEDSDITALQERIEKKYLDEKLIRKIYDHASNHLQIALGEGDEQDYEFDLLKFSKKYELDVFDTYNALEFLENCGYLLFEEKDSSQSKIRIIASREVVYQFQISNPNYDAFLRYLARSYPGIFDQHIPFQLADFSKHLKTSHKRITEQLDFLFKNEIIDYSLKSDAPKIYYLQNRLKSDQLNLNNYRFLKNVAFENLESILDFLKNENCRSTYLRNYFGDSTDENCGKCSYCRKHPSLNESQLLQWIGDGIDLHELIIQSGIPEALILEKIDFLIKEGKLKRSATQFNFILPL
ncbi:MAG: ATP-dependent DNA helicase RecQ [Crocinitomicaceae bacterium]